MASDAALSGALERFPTGELGPSWTGVFVRTCRVLELARRARTLELPGRQPTLRELIGDHYRQDQDALQEDDELARHLALDLQRHLTSRQDPPQDRREDDPDRVVLTEERDRDTGEPEKDDVILGKRPAGGQELLHPHQPRPPARDEEEPDLDRPDRDPTGLRRSRRGAHGASLVPQPCPTNQEPHDDRGADRQEEEP